MCGLRCTSHANRTELVKSDAFAHPPISGTKIIGNKTRARVLKTYILDN